MHEIFYCKCAAEHEETDFETEGTDETHLNFPFTSLRMEFNPLKLGT